MEPERCISRTIESIRQRNLTCDRGLTAPPGECELGRLSFVIALAGRIAFLQLQRERSWYLGLRRVFDISVRVRASLKRVRSAKHRLKSIARRRDKCRRSRLIEELYV